MSKRGIIALCLASLLIAGAITIDCGRAEEGQLPTYKVGDTWTYELEYEGSYYEMTYEVTGDTVVGGRDCWIVKATWTPSLVGVSSGTGKYDKASLFPLFEQASGSVMGVPFTGTNSYSYDPANASFFPLEVGKEVTVGETSEITAAVLGEEDTSTETKTHHYKVEAVQEITVEAGTFKCFKITDGDVTIWYSDKVKQDVKRIEDDGSVMELTYYSV